MEFSPQRCFLSSQPSPVVKFLQFPYRGRTFRITDLDAVSDVKQGIAKSYYRPTTLQVFSVIHRESCCVVPFNV